MVFRAKLRLVFIADARGDALIAWRVRSTMAPADSPMISMPRSRTMLRPTNGRAAAPGLCAG
jgi:hypothetical protein